ncbi:hypothetical protein B0H14DRAFT_3521062 [Mycena olivaceomarginata]|nr:hypothetical protein B0H14DRAFT_3521062 [Mycena olivaceomarginata]
MHYRTLATFSVTFGLYHGLHSLHLEALIIDITFRNTLQSLSPSVLKDLTLRNFEIVARDGALPALLRLESFTLSGHRGHEDDRENLHILSPESSHTLDLDAPHETAPFIAAFGGRTISPADCSKHVFPLYVSTANAKNWTRSRASRAAPGIDLEGDWAPTFGAERGSVDLPIDNRDVDNSLIAPWELTRKLVEGTLVLVMVSFVTYVITDQKSERGDPKPDKKANKLRILDPGNGEPSTPPVPSAARTPFLPLDAV